MSLYSFNNLLGIEQVTADDLEQIFKLADKFSDFPADEPLKGKILSALFFEPSTRTSLSTQAAMNRLGGKVISVVGVGSTSLKKGESFHDTGQTISRFVDIIAMRHPEPYSVEKVAGGSIVPVINCGDGPHEHPTQALLDVYTIYREKGTLDNLKIAMVGDLKYGRTVHSLMKPFKYSTGVEFVFVAPEALQMPKEYLDWLDENDIKYSLSEDIEAIAGCDVVYATRIQQERFEDEAEYQKYKGVYIFNRELCERLFPDGLLMHPLPRVNEIDVDCDNWKGAAYLKQMENGVVVRMALIYGLLN